MQDKNMGGQKTSGALAVPAMLPESTDFDCTIAFQVNFDDI